MRHKKPNRATRSVPTIAAALLALLLGQPALSQDTKPAAKAPAKTTAKPTAKPANVMTRDELRACMDQQDRLKESRSKIDQDQASLDGIKAKVQAFDAELQKKAAAIDPADVGARKALEDEGANRDRLADDYNKGLARLREQAKSFETSRQAWVENCTKKDFDEMDEAAIKKERRANQNK